MSEKNYSLYRECKTHNWHTIMQCDFKEEAKCPQCQIADLTDQLAKVTAENKRLRELMQEFCDRVDKGEVRSKRTYTKFREALKGEE